MKALWTFAANRMIRTPMRRMWGLAHLRFLLCPAGAVPVPQLQRNPHGELPGLCDVQRSEGRCCKAGGRKSAPQPTLPLRKRSGPSPLPSRWTWARGGITSSEGACCQGHYLFTSNTNSSSQPVMEAAEQLKLTATRKAARPEKPEPKRTAAPKPAAGKPKN
jgi:hypothetical protein